MEDDGAGKNAKRHPPCAHMAGVDGRGVMVEDLVMDSTHSSVPSTLVVDSGLPSAGVGR